MEEFIFEDRPVNENGQRQPPSSPFKSPSKKTAVLTRLENSPKKVLSEDDIKKRQEDADRRRKMFEDKKIEKAHAEVTKAQSTAASLKGKAKENIPNEDKKAFGISD